MGQLACPECGHSPTKVLDSRAKASKVKRRRECSECEHRFTTFEVVEGADVAGSATFQVGDYVERKGTYDNWRGKVVGHFETARGIGCCVESAFETNAVRTFHESALRKWKPTLARRIEWTPDMLVTLRDMRAKRCSYLECADRIGVSYNIIAEKCQELGLGGKLNNGRTPGIMVANA